MIRQNYDLFKEINDRDELARNGRLAPPRLVALGLHQYLRDPDRDADPAEAGRAAFSRVFVAGFIAGGTQDVDANLETVRLLRSQLRTKRRCGSSRPTCCRCSTSRRTGRGAAARAAPVGAGRAATARTGRPDQGRPGKDDKAEDEAAANGIRDEKDLEPFERVFANAEYWKRIGEEYQHPLIVTGTVLFTPHTRSGFVQREQEVFDSLGRRRVVPVRTYQERKGYILRPTFIFIDGRTGATLHTETFREEILYNQNQTTPALSSYFELMDRLLPSFLNTLSMQKVKGSRVLLK